MTSSALDDMGFGDPSGGTASSAPAARAASPPPLPDEPDASLIARAALAEGDQDNPASWQNVAGVVVNRMAKSGRSAAAVLAEPGMFEAFRNGHIQGVDTSSPRFRAAQAAIRPVIDGAIKVPYDSFYQPKIVKARGVTPPFPAEQGTMIGSQVFGSGFYRPAAASPSALDDMGFGAPAGAPTSAVPSAPATPAPADQGVRAIVPDKSGAYRDQSGVQYTPIGSGMFLDPAKRKYQVAVPDAGSGGQSGLAVSSTGASAPLPAGQNWIDRAIIGANQGLGNIQTTADRAQAWLDQKIPGMAWLDNRLAPALGLQPGAAAVNSDIVQRNINDATYGGSTAYNLGKFGGEVAGTLPLMAMTGGAAGAGFGALTDAAPALAPAAGFLAGRAGGNLFLRGGSLAASGALQGASAGAIASGANDNPLLQNLREGAEGGAVLGPGGAGAAAALKGAGGVAGRLGGVVGNALMPLTETGRGKIADAVIRRFAAGGPTDINAAEIVPGSTPTLAQATGNPGLAAMERAVAAVRSNPFIARSAENAAARVDALRQVAGTPETIEELDAARDHAALPLLSRALSHGGEADPAPVVSRIDQILASPAGQRDAVASSLGAIRDKLVKSVDAGGPSPISQLETDPAQLYGVRQAITDALSPLAARTGSNAQLASHELMDVKGELDNAIEQAAPGYKDYLQTYARMSGPINAQSYLQGLNLTDAQGNITLAKVKGALDGIAKRQALPGVNNAKSVSPEQIGALQALHADLRRAANSALGKGIGSNTFQNLATHNLMAQGGIPLTAAMGLLSHHPLVAPVAWLGRMAYQAQNEPILDALTSKMLDPAFGATALRPAPGPANPFMSPKVQAMARAVNQNFVPAAVIGANLMQAAPSR